MAQLALWDLVRDSVRRVRRAKSLIDSVPDAVTAGVALTLWVPFGILSRPSLALSWGLRFKRISEEDAADTTAGILPTKPENQRVLAVLAVEGKEVVVREGDVYQDRYGRAFRVLDYHLQSDFFKLIEDDSRNSLSLDTIEMAGLLDDHMKRFGANLGNSSEQGWVRGGSTDS